MNMIGEEVLLLVFDALGVLEGRLGLAVGVAVLQAVSYTHLTPAWTGRPLWRTPPSGSSSGCVSRRW